MKTTPTPSSTNYKWPIIRTLLLIVLFITTYIITCFIGVTLALIGSASLMISIFFEEYSDYVFLAPLILPGTIMSWSLLRFWFIRKENFTRGLIKIDEKDQPELFKLVREIANAVGTKMPAKIFLSPDINAAMIHTSWFWSMIFPTRRSLIIGLGLLQVLNHEEFKAVLAHEFGHFSQRSTRIINYIYVINRVMFDWRYNNDFSRTLQQIGRTNGLMFITVKIVTFCARIVLWPLIQIHALVQYSYSSLSRYMEFQADAIAAGVVSPEAVISALCRIQLGITAKSQVIRSLTKSIEAPVIVDDIYEAYLQVQVQWLRQRQIFIEESQLLRTEVFGGWLHDNRLYTNEQWASHPTIRQREMALSPRNLIVRSEGVPLWNYIRDAGALRVKATRNIYSELNIPKNAIILPIDEFMRRFVNEHKNDFGDPKYGEYYSYHEIPLIEVEEVSEECPHTWEELFNPNVALLPISAERLRNMITTLSEAGKNNGYTSGFELDGIKYPAKSAGQITEALLQELRPIEEELMRHDRRIFRYMQFHAQKAGKMTEWINHLSTYHTRLKEKRNDLQLYSNMRLITSHFYQDQALNPEQAAYRVIEILKLEKVLKPRIKELLADTEMNTYMEKSHLEDLHDYIRDTWNYMAGQNLLKYTFLKLERALWAFSLLATKRSNVAKQDLLKFQLSFAPKKIMSC